MISLPTTAPKSRFVFDFRPERALLATEWKLDTITGQAATFSRPSASTSIDSNGRSIAVAHSVPRFEWGELDFDDGETTVGVRIDGDDLSYDLLVPVRALTLYVRLRRHDAPAAGAVVVAIGGASGVRLVITENASGTYTATYNDGTTSFTSTTVRPFFSGAAVELRCVLQASGLQLFCSLFGDDEEAGSVSAALTFPAAWASPIAFVGATTALANPSNNTFVRVAMGLGDFAITAFRPVLRGGAVPPVGLALVETAPGEFAFVEGGTVGAEMVDVLGDGNYTIVAIGTSPGQPRVTAHRTGSASHVLLY